MHLLRKSLVKKFCETTVGANGAKKENGLALSQTTVVSHRPLHQTLHNNNASFDAQRYSQSSNSLIPHHGVAFALHRNKWQGPAFPSAFVSYRMKRMMSKSVGLI